MSIAKLSIWLIGVSITGVVSSQSGGDVPENTLSSTEIIARMMEGERARTAALRECTSIRSYFLENKRFNKTAETTVKATYRRPGDKEFEVLSQSGSGVLQRKVFRRMLDSEMEATKEPMREATQITPDNYDFLFTGVDHDRGRRAFVFEISPKVWNKFMIKARIWLDSEDFAITRIEGSPAKSPSIWMRRTTFVQTYQKHGAFWMAASNVWETDMTLFGHTSIQILYSDYRFNPDPQ